MQPVSTHVFFSLFTVLSIASITAACGSQDDAGSSPTRAPSSQDDGGAADPNADASAPAATVVPGINTPNETAGTRLKPIYLQISGADSSEMLTLRGWHDVERDEACTFQKLTDNKLHCAPYGQEPALTRDAFFQDAGCTMPVIGFRQYDSGSGNRCSDPSPFATKRYVRIRANAQCAAPRLAEVPKTGRLAVTSVYRRNPNGTCETYPLGTEPYEVFASPTPLEEIDPSSFVTMTVQNETPATNTRLRISRTIHTGSDGSKSISSQRMIDSDKNEICWNTLDANGEYRCMPRGGDLSEYGMSDSTCTKPAWSVANNGGCEDDGRNTFSRYMTRRDSCYRTQLFPRFSTTPLSTIYGGTGPGMCSPSAVPTDSTAGYFYYASQPIPGELAPAGFVRIDHVERDAPSGEYGKKGTRLAHRLWGDAARDGFELASYITQYDHELKTTCYPTTLPDGKSYCVGSYTWFSIEPTSGIFADAACTDAVAGVAKANPACGNNGALSTVIDARYLAARPYSQNGCETLRLHQRGTPISVATLYQRNSSGICTAAPYYKATDYDLYRVADLKEVPASTFAPVTTKLVH